MHITFFKKIKIIIFVSYKSMNKSAFHITKKQLYICVKQRDSFI